MRIDNIDQVKLACRLAYPQEACFTVKDNIATQQENVHQLPTENFSMKQQVCENIDSIDAIIHSHTFQHTTSIIDPRAPSYADMQLAEKTNLPQGILHCDGKEVTDILWFNDTIVPLLLSRRYIPNVFDCYTLVADYYRSKLDHKLKILPRTVNWSTETPMLMAENLDNQGLTEVSRTNPQEHDVLVFKIASRFPNHIGVYLGDDKFIHQLYRQPSYTDELRKWARQLYKVYRLEQ